MKTLGFVLYASLALILVAPASADEVQLDGVAITAALTDHVFQGEDRTRKTEQIFQKNGTTYYSVDGSQSQGRWQVQGDQYCSQWPPGESWSCYDVLADGGLITFVSKSGERYAVRQIN